LPTWNRTTPTTSQKPIGRVENQKKIIIIIINMITKIFCLKLKNFSCAIKFNKKTYFNVGVDIGADRIQAAFCFHSQASRNIISTLIKS
jgi:hypothetical protein